MHYVIGQLPDEFWSNVIAIYLEQPLSYKHIFIQENVWGQKGLSEGSGHFGCHAGRHLPLWHSQLTFDLYHPGESRQKPWTAATQTLSNGRTVKEHVVKFVKITNSVFLEEVLCWVAITCLLCPVFEWWISAECCPDLKIKFKVLQVSSRLREAFSMCTLKL